MAFLKNTTTIVNNNTNIFHTSYQSVSSNIQSNYVLLQGISDIGQNIGLGNTVAVGSGRVLVSTPTGGISGRGMVYVYNTNGNTVATLYGTNNFEKFGSAVAVKNGTIAIGANNANGGTGRVYTYDLNGNLKSTINPSDGGVVDSFGSSISISSGHIIIGSPIASGAVSSSGSVYVYRIDGSNVRKIRGSTTSERFGASVCANDGLIVIGSPTLTVGSNTSQGRVSVYSVFDSNNSLYVISNPQPAASDRFGNSVAIGCGRIVVGVPGDDDNGSSSGSAYIFDYNGTQLAKIKPSDGAIGDEFGTSVAIGSNYIIVGSPFDDYDSGSNMGSAYLFNLDGTQITKLTALGSSNSNTGTSVAIGEGRILVGSPGTDINYFEGESSTYYADAGQAVMFSIPENHDIYFEKILSTFRY